MPFSTELPPQGTSPWYTPFVVNFVGGLRDFVNNLETIVNGKASAAQGAKADTAVQPAAIAGFVPGTRTVAGKPLSANVTLAKADVGLANVDNTADAAKPISTAQAAALAAKADLVGGVIPTAQIPAIAISEYLGTVNSEAALLALVGQKGDWAIRSDNSTTWVISGDTPAQIASWTQIQTPTGGGGAVTTVNGQSGVVVLDAAAVGAATAAQGTKADAAVPSTRTVAGKPLSGNITLVPADIGAATAAQGGKADTAVQPAGIAGMVRSSDSSVTLLFSKPTLAEHPATGVVGALYFVDAVPA